MEKEKTYTIYTDASFDAQTKLGTYAVIIMQENIVIKMIAKKCRIQLNNSIECEIFAIYQAINIILSCYIKKNKIQKFKIKTDCIGAKEFFVDQNYNMKIFKNEKDLLDIIKNKYKQICRKLLRSGCSFTLKWVPRNANKIAHKYSYLVFKRLKKINSKNEILTIDLNLFITILTTFNKKQCEIILHLINNANQQKIIIITQKQIAEFLNIPISTINKSFNELIELNIIEKVKNGKYALLI